MKASDTEEERFIRLETKTAYLEKGALDLEEVVIAQSNLIKDLARRLEQLERQLQSDPDGSELPHEKPPHY